MIHYNSQLTYQKDSKFVPVGINSIHRMQVLSQSGGYLFVHKDSSGFVFCEKDINQAKNGNNLLPVMVVKLRESGIKDWKQAHGLRIRKYYADESVAKKWYFEYIKQIAPLVSDTQHLQGGYLLWKHFLKNGHHPHINISAWDLSQKKMLATNLTLDHIEESTYWSQHPDHSKSDIVLSMEHIEHAQSTTQVSESSSNLDWFRDLSLIHQKWMSSNAPNKDEACKIDMIETLQNML